MSNIDIAHVNLVAARGLYANGSMTMAEVGIHVFMALYGLAIFLETPPELRKGRAKYIFISFVITSLTILTASLDAAWSLRVFLETTEITEFFKVTKKYGTVWGEFLSGSAMAVVMIIGDALLLYRCYIMWIHRRWVVILPGLTYLASIALGVANLATQRPNSHLGEYTFELTWVFLSVSTNVLITALISYRLIVARRNFSEVLVNRNMQVYTGAVSILIESALPLSVFGIVCAAFMVAKPKMTSTAALAAFQAGYLTFSGLFYSFSALSPHMIIFRITTGRSWIKTPLANDGSMVISRPIDFGHNNFTANSDDVESSRSFVVSNMTPAQNSPTSARRDDEAGFENVMAEKK